ncbi:MAG: SDR family NAD(P)-dependent oxidoreductase [Cyanobacteria bacterium P01_A01_bin.105]
MVIGASRGIGAAVTQHFVAQGDHVMAVSRSQAVAGEWVKADISTKEGIRTVVIAVGDSPLDALLFMGGVWEAGAFTSQYD